jgi:PucR family transcriptional regulator, purine catabolism regulatory protein
MVVSLAQVLDLDVVRRAAPRVAYGEHLLDRRVRWVHTSELVEAAALLKGGELLLTTGLGLSGRGPVAQRGYIDELANRRAAALVLELGWTFSEVPEPLLEAARRRELPVIALHEIIPFVVITEEVQRQLLHESLAQLSLERHVTHLLHERLLQGDGLTGIIEALAQLLSCPVVLEDLDGVVVAETGGGPSRRWLDKAVEVRSGSVSLRGEAWGELHVVDPPQTARAVLPTALEVGAAAVAMTLLRGTPPPSPSTRIRLQREFLQDLVAGRFRRSADAMVAASAHGLHLGRRMSLTGFAVGGYRSADAQILLSAVERAAAALGPSLVGEIDGLLLGVVQGASDADGYRVAQSLLERVDDFAGQRAAGRPSRLAVGPTVTGEESLARTVREARAALLLADKLLLPDRIVTARGMVADRLLASVVEDRHLADVIEGELGALLEHDAAHGTDLVDTLYAVLAGGDSKSATADALHIRRQTLYKRLAKIESLIGDLGDPEWRVSLLVALRAQRLLARRPRATPPGR